MSDQEPEIANDGPALGAAHPELPFLLAEKSDAPAAASAVAPVVRPRPLTPPPKAPGHHQVDQRQASKVHFFLTLTIYQSAWVRMKYYLAALFLSMFGVLAVMVWSLFIHHEACKLHVLAVEKLELTKQHEFAQSYARCKKLLRWFGG
jgi:hypothetical protein